VRRSLRFVLVGLAILVGLASMSLPQVALAHGSVDTNRALVSNDAHLAAYYNYYTTQVHPRVCVHVILQERPGDGGTWTDLRNSSQCDRNLSGSYWVVKVYVYSCKNDYRAIGRGVSYSARGRAHLEASDTSKIIQNWC
jgi:hypothetical protein